jgi:hypothetical protein
MSRDWWAVGCERVGGGIARYNGIELMMRSRRGPFG